MSFLSKLGRTVRTLGTKLTHTARTVGNKVGNFLLGATPVLAAIPGIGPEAAAFSASVGAAAKGVGSLAGVAENALAGRGLDIGAARAGFDQAKSGVGAVKSAYGAIRGRGSQLEKRS